MHLSIKRRFTILEKRKGHYHAFPTIIKQQDRLWLACRSGLTSSEQAHGIGGKVKLFQSETASPHIWTCRGPLFEPSKNGSYNELDAILSAPAPDLIFLATRDYKYQERNIVYLSSGGTPVLTQRKPLADISDLNAICFGHIRKAANGDLLMPGYCGFPDEPSGTPVLLASGDNGQTWTLRAKPASSTQAGTRLTEYSLGYLGENRWTALIRNETPPFELYQADTRDDGLTWTNLRKTDLCGHAPMILDSESNHGHLVIYRDLSQELPGIAIGNSTDQGKSWKKIGRLASYHAGIYDGGYGDMIQLEENLYLATYYLCDTDNSPWIAGCLFSLTE